MTLALVAALPRGAMEIILGLLAIQAGLINDRMFVALVIVALLTSLIAGPSVNFLVERRRVAQLKGAISGKLFTLSLHSRTYPEVIHELCEAAAAPADRPAERLYSAVWNRESISRSEVVNGVVTPHARLPGVEKPIVTVGLHKTGVNLGSGYSDVARLFVMVITGDNQSQIELLSDVGRLFHRPETVEQALSSKSFR